MIVREATLDDAKDIASVYKSNPDSSIKEPIENLSIEELVKQFGPWMSEDTCAVHLHNLIAWGSAPLVVEEKGKVIAEVEYFIGQDYHPFDLALNISVLYVHSKHQHQGAGTLLMEELISRARLNNCNFIIVTGDIDAPDYYAKFDFSSICRLPLVDHDISFLHMQSEYELFIPLDFIPPPRKVLWIGRYNSPLQTWKDIVNGVRKQDPIFTERFNFPYPVAFSSVSNDFVGAFVPRWKDRTTAEVLCWVETVTSGTVYELIDQARFAGYDHVRFICHPDVADVVVETCGGVIYRSLEIWGKKL